MKILTIILFLLIVSNANADSLGVNKTINDYLDNGYELQSISIIKEDKITLEAELFSLDGTQRFYEKKSSNILNCEKLGIEVGKILKEKSKEKKKKK